MRYTYNFNLLETHCAFDWISQTILLIL